jgi:hypothetical protein
MAERISDSSLASSNLSWAILAFSPARRAARRIWRELRVVGRRRALLKPALTWFSEHLEAELTELDTEIAQGE